MFSLQKRGEQTCFEFFTAVVCRKPLISIFVPLFRCQLLANGPCPGGVIDPHANILPLSYFSSPACSTIARFLWTLLRAQTFPVSQQILCIRRHAHIQSLQCGWERDILSSSRQCDVFLGRFRRPGFDVCGLEWGEQPWTVRPRKPIRFLKGGRRFPEGARVRCGTGGAETVGACRRPARLGPRRRL